DHCPYNDTVRRNVVVLLTHDVGVTEIALSPDFDNPPDRYNTGRAVTITATVENFGYNQESNVPVRCEILDKTADPDTLVYHNIQTIVTLDWRGNTLDNSYTAEVTFPVWTVPSTNWFTITCKTELAGDMCPDDDFEVLNPGAIDEGKTGPKAYFLEVTNAINEGEARLRFAVLHSDWVKISVFDINGRYVASVQNNPMEPGYYTRTWNGKDDSGRKCSAGIYIVRMEAEGFTASKKAVILN
ncbi:T9SS type A sorting domain-containing protein, partial [bacterium]|nr:T9SS type A sorting domain-containing protein [bacterium]